MTTPPLSETETAALRWIVSEAVRAYREAVATALEKRADRHENFADLDRANEARVLADLIRKGEIIEC